VAEISFCLDCGLFCFDLLIQKYSKKFNNSNRIEKLSNIYLFTLAFKSTFGRFENAKRLHNNPWFDVNIGNVVVAVIVVTSNAARRR